MLVQLPPTASSMMNVVSRIIITAMPSMPSVKRMPHDGIQLQSTTDCHPVCDGSKLHQSPSETMNSIAKVTSTMNHGIDAPPDVTSSPGVVDVAAPPTQINTAPASGMASSARRTQD